MGQKNQRNTPATLDLLEQRREVEAQGPPPALPVEATDLKHPEAVEDVRAADAHELVEGLEAALCHEIPVLLECRDVHVVPRLKAPEQQPLEAVEARQLGGVAADDGVGVLPVEDMRGLIVVDLAARGLHEQVGPPVVGRHLHLPRLL